MKANSYLYNGKEIQNDLNLGLYDFGARFYDPVIGRWNGMDPLAEKFSSWTPYHFVHNNPIKLIDPDGRSAMPPGDYYDEQGNWIANDRIDDDKVYHADEGGDITFGLGVLKKTQFKERSYTISDSKLEEYFPTLLDHEGGFVNHPHDPGGQRIKG